MEEFIRSDPTIQQIDVTTGWNLPPGHKRRRLVWLGKVTFTSGKDEKPQGYNTTAFTFPELIARMRMDLKTLQDVKIIADAYKAEQELLGKAVMNAIGRQKEKEQKQIDEQEENKGELPEDE
jgi:hypothetical protein